MPLRYSLDAEAGTVTVLMETDAPVAYHDDSQDHGLAPTDTHELQHFVGIELTPQDLTALFAAVTGETP